MGGGRGEANAQHVTVQTLKSLIWRRRFYELSAGEVRLYKAEGVSFGLGLATNARRAH